MTRFVILSLLLLAFGFYELSGGADFDPEAQRDAAVDARVARAAERNETIVAALSRPASPASTVEQRNTIETVETETVTRAKLNLVAFETATATADAPETRTIANPELQSSASRSEIAALATEAAQDQNPLSLASLDTDTDAADRNVFSGSSQVAQSARAVGTTDIRRIKGTLVNMRSGPGTEYDVIDQLPQATEVEILSAGGNGWVELRPVGGGQTGWIAEFLLVGG